MAEHILANIDFSSDALSIGLQKKLSLQLSALSFYLGSQADKAILQFKPDANFLKQLHALKAPISSYVSWEDLQEKAIINPWAKTEKLFLDCNLRNFHLKYPLSQIETKSASKAFAFELLPPPFLSCLVQSKEEALNFLKLHDCLFVMKSALDQSGLGHHFIKAHHELTLACMPDISYQNIRVEKWVKRVLDFSSQWLICDSVNLLGLCEIFNNEKGGYRGSKFPLEYPAYEEFFKEHIAKVRPILEILQSQGFRGHIGVDAFIFQENMQILLCPMIEMNPRKTMGYLALHLALHFKKSCFIEITNKQSPHLLLPQVIHTKNATLQYKTNIAMQLQ